MNRINIRSYPCGGSQTYKFADRVWVTADTHFGHSNVIGFCGRPFQSCHEMDEEMVLRWNAKVSHGSLVIHLGDFALVGADRRKAILSRLNGRLLVVPGNHDKGMPKELFLPPLCRVDWKGITYTLCHFPLESWRPGGAVHLHGHCHGNARKVKNRYDVGVDAWNFEPILLESLT